MTGYAIANGIGFQLCWWAIVLTAAHGHPEASVACAGAGVAAHLAFVKERRSEVAVLVLCGIVGFVVDSAQMQLGLFRTAGSDAAFCPPWLVGLWMAFGTTLNHSLGWLQGKPLLAAGLSAFGGASGYAGGVALGAMTTPYPFAATFAIWFVVWAPMLPALQLAAAAVRPRLDPLKGDS